MNIKAVKKAIKKIAIQEAISEDEVREEMQKAIMAGYLNSETRQMWNTLFGENVTPTPEEFIIKVGELIAKEIIKK